MIRTIFFDLDDTLLDFTRTEAAAMRQTLSLMGIMPTGAILRCYHAINRKQWELLEEGKLTREELLVRRFDLLFAELGLSGSGQEASELYERFLSHICIFMPGAQTLLQTLAPKYALYLVTNGTEAVQQSRLRLSGLEAYIQGVFISQRIGYDKPSPDYFRACFTSIADFDPAAALIVGDSLTSDIRGGRDAGIQTCWFNPFGRHSRTDIRPDFQITALEQLPALLQSRS